MALPQQAQQGVRRTPAPLIDRREQSILIARAKGYRATSWAVKLIDFQLDLRTGELREANFRIQSESDRNRQYYLRYDPFLDDTNHCACRSGNFHHPCWHVGATLLQARELRAIYSLEGQASAQREFYRDIAFEDNSRCLGY